jgi:hypothetical protein
MLEKIMKGFNPMDIW